MSAVWTMLRAAPDPGMADHIGLVADGLGPTARTVSLAELMEGRVD
jgi:hypothetical protein